MYQFPLCNYSLTTCNCCTNFIALANSSSYNLHTHSHVNQEGVNNARKLCQSLIDTVKKDSIAHKASQSGPLGFGAAPHYNSNAGTGT